MAYDPNLGYDPDLVKINPLNPDPASLYQRGPSAAQAPSMLPAQPYVNNSLAPTVDRDIYHKAVTSYPEQLKQTQAETNPDTKRRLLGLLLAGAAGAGAGIHGDTRAASEAGANVGGAYTWGPQQKAVSELNTKLGAEKTAAGLETEQEANARKNAEDTSIFGLRSAETERARAQAEKDKRQIEPDLEQQYSTAVAGRKSDEMNRIAAAAGQWRGATATSKRGPKLDLDKDGVPTGIWRDANDQPHRMDDPATPNELKMEAQAYSQTHTRRLGEEESKEKRQADYRENAQTRGFGEREKLAAQKTWQPVGEAWQRLQTMQHSIDEIAKNPNSPTHGVHDLNILTAHVGMTYGGMKGGRMTQRVWEDFQKDRPWLHSVQVFFDHGLATGAILTPQQRDAMLGLARDRYDLAKQQAGTTAGTFTPNAPVPTYGGPGPDKSSGAPMTVTLPSGKKVTIQ